MRTFLKVLGFVAGFAVVPALAQAETLADALASAYKSSNLLDQNQAVLRAADEDAAIAMANLRPVLNFVSRGSWRQFDQNITNLGGADNSNSASVELTGQIVLWAGGRGKLSLEAARAQVLSTRAASAFVSSEMPSSTTHSPSSSSRLHRHTRPNQALTLSHAT